MNISAISLRQAGFTLIELMITVAVLAVLLAIAVPSFQELTRNMALSGAANEMVGGIQFARSEAVRLNQTVDFQAKTDRSWVVSKGGVTIREGRYSDQITALGTAVGVSFGSAGSVSVSTDFCLKIVGYGKSKKVTIERIGRTMIEDKGADCT